MAWDSSRPVPWKRLFTFVGIYSLIVFGLFAVLKPDQMLKSLPGLVFGALVALMVMAVLTKFGWQPTMLKSRAQMAEQRAQQQAERDARKSSRASAGTAASAGKAASAGSGGDGAPRPKPPPTKRTTPGPTNNPRRTRANRKR